MGTIGWSQALSQELQPEVRVTIIEPGAAATEMTDHITHPQAKQRAEQLWAQVAITAELVLFAVTRPDQVHRGWLMHCLPCGASQILDVAGGAENATVRERTTARAL